jgi:hypothetical protein
MSGKKEGFVGRPGPEGGKAGGREQGGRSSKKSPGRLSRTDQHRIGDLLQRVYDDVLGEGVPDRFKALLDKLEPSGSASGSGGAGPSDGSAPEQQSSSQISASANSQNRESTE